MSPPGCSTLPKKILKEAHFVTLGAVVESCQLEQSCLERTTSVQSKLTRMRPGSLLKTPSFFDDEDHLPVDFVQAEISMDTEVDDCLDRFDSTFDVVIMNPPFGTKTSGIDLAFLHRALSLVRPSGYVYSLHKSSTRDFLPKKLLKSEEAFGVPVSGHVVAEVRYDLPKIYKFQKEKSLDIQVDFWAFQKLANQSD